MGLCLRVFRHCCDLRRGIKSQKVCRVCGVSHKVKQSELCQHIKNAIEFSERME